MPTVKWVTVFARKCKFENFSAQIEAHLKLATSVSQEEGHSYEEARAAAHRAFGNLSLANWYGVKVQRNVALLHRSKTTNSPATRGPTLCPLSKFSWCSLPAVLVAAVSLKQIAQILRFRVGGSAQQRLNVEDFL